MSELQVHLALIRENWDRHDHWFDALCNNLVRGHMKELEALAAQSPPPVVSEGVEAAIIGATNMTTPDAVEMVNNLRLGAHWAYKIGHRTESEQLLDAAAFIEARTLYPPARGETEVLCPCGGTVTPFNVCRKCGGDVDDENARISSPSRGCDAGEDYGPGSPWSEGYNSGFAAGSREPSETVEACAKVAEEHAETKFGPDEPESIEEWRRGFVAASETIAAAIRNLGKETREGEG